MRVVVELKRDTNPHEVLQRLYQLTALQGNFGVTLLALVEGQPRQLSLRQVLHEFLKFREHTLNRRYTYDLQKKQSRLHLVSGLLKALVNIDLVIEVLRSAADGSTAKMTLANELDLSQEQADAILAMPLRRLTNLEQQNLQQESEELEVQINTLHKLLNDRRELLKALKKDLRSLKRKYSDPRRTKIIESYKPDSPQGANKQKNSRGQISSLQIPPQEVRLEFTQRGYVRRLQNTGKKSKAESAMPDNDFVIQSTIANTQEDLLVITSGGKVYPISVGDIPRSSGRSARGTPLITLLSPTAQSNQENIINRFIIPENPENNEIILVTRQGRIKRLSLAEISNLTRRGVTIIKLKDDDELLCAQFISAGEQLILASSGGRLLRFEVNDEEVSVMGRTAMGLQGMRLGKQQKLIACVKLVVGKNLLLVTQQGYAKCINLSRVKLAHRGDLGAQSLKFAVKTDNLAGVVQTTNDTEVALVTNHQRLVRLSVENIPLSKKDDKGKMSVQLNRDEQVITAIPMTTTKN